MGVLKAEPAKVQDWATTSVGAYWRAYDLQLAIYALLLAGLGLAMSYSSTVVTGVNPLDPSSNFLRGLMWSGIAVIVFIAATFFDYKWLKTFAWPIYFVNLGLLALSLVIGTGVGGAARWIAIGPLQFQFSELAKILMIVVLANYLAERHDRLGSLRVILGACVLMVPTWVLVMLQPDLGTSLVLAGILAGMLFLSGASMKWLGALAGLVIALVPIAWNYILRDYQKQRLLSFLNPASDPQGSGYQLLQSQIAVGSGGLFGKGLTNGTQDALAFLPVGDTDFAFARIGRGARLHRRRARLRPVRRPALAGADGRLPIAGPVRHDLRRGDRLDAAVPAGRQRGHGDRAAADHRDPAAVHHPGRRVADQPGDRAGDPAEHQHPAIPGRVVIRRPNLG